MPKSGKLPLLAIERGQTVEEMIAAMLEEHGTPYRVAAELGVHDNAIRHWMKVHGGYEFRPGKHHRDGEWVRTDEAAHA